MNVMIQYVVLFVQPGQACGMSENERRLISESEALKSALEQLLARVAELEARLKNSGNS